MTYVIAEPCIGTKDNSCVEVCPVDCIHPTPDEPGTTTRRSSTSTRRSASTATPASRRALSMRSSPRTSCPTSGRSTSRSTPTTTSADQPLVDRNQSDRERPPTAASLPRGRSDRGQRSRRAGRDRRRAGSGGSAARALEGTTLFLAAAAYVAHVLAHHETARELLTRSILVSAFALWGLVQIAPGLPGNAVLNDIVIVLFVVDLAILVSPWL